MIKIKSVLEKVSHGVEKMCIQLSVLFWMAVINTQHVFAAKDPSAKSFSKYILSDWVSPIFALVIVIFIIKLVFAQDFVKAALLLVGGGLIYLFIKDPDGFLATLSALPKRFGF